MSGSIRLTAIAAGTLLAVALAPAAVSAHEGIGGNDILHACAHNGEIRMANATSSAQCPDGWRVLHWAIVGEQGAQGPVGPVGPQGPVGPRGAPGLAALEVVNSSFTVPAGSTAVGNVYCPAGKVAISGGFAQPTFDLIPTDSYALPDLSGWRVWMKSTATVDLTAGQMVVCAQVGGAAGIDWRMPRAVTK